MSLKMSRVRKYGWSFYHLFFFFFFEISQVNIVKYVTLWLTISLCSKFVKQNYFVCTTISFNLINQDYKCTAWINAWKYASKK